MESLHLYDSLTRQVRPVQPGPSGRFRMYVCGPTVYGPAHIGNFITFLRFDSLYRLLQLAGYHPLYVRNITDVDDKTIKGAQEAGQSLHEFTDLWTRRFHQDCQKLNLLPPDHEPRATEHIPQQIELVRQLVERQFAYQAPDGSVYYRVHNFPDYGKLSHFDPQSLQSQQTNSAGHRNLSDEYERDSIADFALWKAHKDTDGPVSWESPWGPGRPGWHLECSAMSLQYLGANFDLHGGGEDLCFPHHENEIAQSEAATGQPFARHWVHTVHLLVEGRKMAKSEGNFFLLSDLIDKGFHPAEIRTAFLGGHYRQQFNFTLHALEAARSALSKFENNVDALLQTAGWSRKDWHDAVTPQLPDQWGPFKDAWNAVRRDFNTPALLGALHKAFRMARKETEPANAAHHLRAAAALFHVLGIPLFQRPAPDSTSPHQAPEAVRQLAQQRQQARQNRDFDTADQLRDQIKQAGYAVIDQPDGFTLQPTNS